MSSIRAAWRRPIKNTEESRAATTISVGSFAGASLGISESLVVDSEEEHPHRKAGIDMSDRSRFITMNYILGESCFMTH